MVKRVLLICALIASILQVPAIGFAHTATSDTTITYCPISSVDLDTGTTTLTYDTTESLYGVLYDTTGTTIDHYYYYTDLCGAGAAIDPVYFFTN